MSSLNQVYFALSAEMQCTFPDLVPALHPGALFWCFGILTNSFQDQSSSAAEFLVHAVRTLAQDGGADCGADVGHLSGGWLLTRDVDVFIAKKLELNDKRALRQVCRAAKAVVDSTVTSATHHSGTPALPHSWDVETINACPDEDQLSEYLAAWVKMPMKRLHSLTLSGAHLSVGQLSVLRQAPWISQLTQLEAPIDDSAFHEFGRIAEACSGLTRLSLFCGYRHSDSLLTLGSARAMPKLKELHLDYFRMNGPVGAWLFGPNGMWEESNWRRLTNLRLTGITVDELNGEREEEAPTPSH